MYRLVQFGTTSLSYYNQVDAIGSGATPAGYIALPEGGALDGYGSAQKAPGVVERLKSMRLHGSSEAALSAIFFGLMALRGKRDKLYRELEDGSQQWMYARLAEITAGRTFELTRYHYIQDIELRFICQEATWRGIYGGSFFLDSGEVLDNSLTLDSTLLYALTSSPYTIVINQGSEAGRAPVRGLRIVAVAGSAAITEITIARTGGESLTFLGPLAAGELLEIDCGTMQVICPSLSNPYNYLVLDDTADLAAWFTLQQGANEIIVTYTGGGTGSIIQFYFYEAWY